MKFKLESTCLKCGSRDIEAALGMGQGSGYLNMKCRSCGESEGWDDQGHGAQDIEFVFDVGNGIRSMPWTYERFKMEVENLTLSAKEKGLNPTCVYVSANILDELDVTELFNDNHARDKIMGLRIYEVSSSEEIIEVGGFT